MFLIIVIISSLRIHVKKSFWRKQLLTDALELNRLPMEVLPVSLLRVIWLNKINWIVYFKVQICRLIKASPCIPYYAYRRKSPLHLAAVRKYPKLNRKPDFIARVIYFFRPDASAAQKSRRSFSGRNRLTRGGVFPLSLTLQEWARKPKVKKSFFRAVSHRWLVRRDVENRGSVSDFQSFHGISWCPLGYVVRMLRFDGFLIILLLSHFLAANSSTKELLFGVIFLVL